MLTRQQLIDRITRFRARHGLTETNFGIEAMNDPSFMIKLRRGRAIGLDTANHLVDWMRRYKPSDRPKKKPSESRVA
jgi:hypothetical protein